MSKWALALEGGSLRCMFSAGAADVMMEHNLWADGVFGVSAGALTGVSYVSGQIGRTAQVNLSYVNDKRYLGLGNLIFKKSIFNFDFLFGEISDKLIPLDREAFAKSPMKFTAVCTDCRTGQPTFFEKHACGDIYGAIRASASMPLLSPIVEVGGAPYVDGGVSCSIPYAKPLEEGYDKVVVITTREHGYRKPQVPYTLAKLYAKHYQQYPQLVQALLDTPRRYGRELEELDRLEAEGKIFVLRPPEPVTVSRTEKDLVKLRELYAQGRRVCLERMEGLVHYLES
ncbi:MAG: patatin-like phospholipase family protein [Acutalibacter sp.]|jgi:predicted patatin/cPLA2 family phospholipase